MSKYLMALDQGTTSSRCILFDFNGEAAAAAQKEHKQIFPREGWVEHDPAEIWSNQLSVALEAMAKIGAGAKDVAAIGVTNQRETTVVWDKNTGKPVYNAIVWQCRRTSDFCDTLKSEGFDAVIAKKTGLTADAYFSGAKIKWILDNVPGALEAARRGRLLFGTVDAWLLWNLTRGAVFATDYSNASRTMLFNIHTLKWDTEILDRFDIPAAMLPEVLPTAHIFGGTHRDFFGAEIPVAGMAGDQQAALFGQACFIPGMVKNTYGTGCFTLMHTGGKAAASKNGLLTTIAWGLGGGVEYALEGSVFTAGSVIQWLRDGLNMITDAAETEAYAQKTENANGVYIVPAFVGLGAPYWDQHARGLIAGLTFGARKEHIIRAALESIAYQSYDVISAMAADTSQTLTEIRADGGASVNNFLMQFQADILGAAVCRPAMVESTALGAAFLAGLAAGVFGGKEEIAKKVSIDRVFTPAMNPLTRNGLLSGWKDAVKKAGEPGRANKF